jgi:hypothetical protein
VHKLIEAQCCELLYLHLYLLGLTLQEIFSKIGASERVGAHTHKALIDGVVLSEDTAGTPEASSSTAATESTSARRLWAQMLWLVYYKTLEHFL